MRSLCFLINFVVAPIALCQPFLEQNGTLIIEAESFDRNIPRDQHAFAVSRGERGYSGASAMRALPEDTKAWTSNWESRAPELRFRAQISTPGLYRFWVRTYGYRGSSDSIHVGLDGRSIGTVTNVPDGWFAWTDLGSAQIPSGLRDVNLWVRETGVVVDKLLLTTDFSFSPSGIGGSESPRAGENRNRPPIVSIREPGAGSSWLSTDSVQLAGTAEDAEDGDLSSGLDWHSDRDGPLGSGSSFGVTLTAGTHRVSAEVADSAGASGSATVEVRVTDPGGGSDSGGGSGGDGGNDTRGDEDNSSDDGGTTGSSGSGGDTGNGGDSDPGSGGSGSSGNTDQGGSGGSSDGAFTEFNGTVVFEAEHYSENLRREGHEWRPSIEARGYSGIQAMRGLPEDTRAWTRGFESRAPELRYPIAIQTQGNYQFWVRTYGWGGSSDSLHVGVNGHSIATVTNVPDGRFTWYRMGSLTLDQGRHTVSVWLRETGMTLDKILLTTDSRVQPSGLGPVESPRGDANGSPSGEDGRGDTGTGKDRNRPPEILGQPPTTVRVGEPYEFVPTGSDPDGDSLVFGIRNKPNWASFDAPSGRLRGTPGSGDVREWRDITIDVTDGENTAQLATFSIVVEPLSLGSVTLSWVAPTRNEDGSRLTDLAGYRIYWGERPGSYPNSLRIEDPAATNYTVQDLEPGSYRFAMTAIDSDGTESRFSNVAAKTVP